MDSPANDVKTFPMTAINMGTRKYPKEQLAIKNACRFINPTSFLHLSYRRWRCLAPHFRNSIEKRIQSDLRFLAGNSQICLGQKNLIENILCSDLFKNSNKLTKF